MAISTFPAVLVPVGLPLCDLSDRWTRVADPSSAGIFLRYTAPEAACFFEGSLGRLRGLRRFTGGFRHRPFWMKPVIGSREEDVPWETQWLLAELEDDRFVFVAPLLDGGMRFSLRGGADGLVAVGESGDPTVVTPGGIAVFVAQGDEPFELLARSARAMQRHSGGRLRADKRVPDFVERFGWCTWDAFYRDVSPEKIRAGLASFAAAGVAPRWLLIDDGWQSTQRAPTGEERLTSLAPNERFGGDLAPTVRMAREEFGVSTVLVWHALLGYWGGLDEGAFAHYRPRTVARAFGPGILAQDPTWNVRPWGAQVGVPAGGEVARFYDEYHRLLAAQGVDGVKVDNQAMLEAVSAGQGGRVALARTFRTALETSTRRHFAGRLINCMACTTEAAYLAADSTVLRTSDDYYPQRPESHGEHIFNNAHTSLWFGEFMLPDWDMFQSDHALAASTPRRAPFRAGRSTCRINRGLTMPRSCANSC